MAGLWACSRHGPLPGRVVRGALCSLPRGRGRGLRLALGLGLRLALALALGPGAVLGLVPGRLYALGGKIEYDDEFY